MMAEAVPFGVAANILSKLASPALQEIGLVYGVNKELKKLESTLSTIKAVLLDAEERQEKSHLVQDWIRKLKDVVYEADDVLDAFSTKALQHKLKTNDTVKEQVHEFFSSSNPLAFRIKMGHKIREIRERIDEIAVDMSKFNFRERIIEIGVQNWEREQTHSFVLTSEAIGRDKDKEEIIDLLMCSSSQENFSVIAIVGIGGLGKTTLAQLVYNDDRVVEFFELRMWVCVSEDFDVKILVQKLIRSATDEEVGNFDMDQLQSRLRASLDGKRFLLVLDDVWNENNERWFGLKNLLMGGGQGSTIVVTTRTHKVASVMGAKNFYVLEGLTEDKSWALFERLAFKGRQEKMHPSLITIAKDIVKKCKGVPLAIRTIGSAMQSKSRESEWLSVQNSEIWMLSQNNNDILPVLKLSYDHLPIHLRQCFAYCSIFPKDFRFCKETLIQLWMAQGYIQSSDGNELAEDIGDRYFKDLLSRSIFQEAEEDDCGNIESCKMHDLIHDLAQTVAGTDCFMGKIGVENISERVHHVSLEHSSDYVHNLLRSLLKVKGLRTFLLAEHRWIDISSHLTNISNFRTLRVLDLSYSGVETLPNSIGKLKHLRYLDLSDNRRMERLPSTLCNLHNLQTLKLSDCISLTELPRDTRKLINLKYLMIDGCNNLTHMPVGLGKLISLQILPRFVVGVRDWRLLRTEGTLNELNGLNHLRGELTLGDLENVRDAALESKEVNLEEKKYLQSLRLEWLSWRDGDQNSSLLLDNLRPHPNLKELYMSGYRGIRFSHWLSSITNLVKITIEGCGRCKHLPPLDQLPSLEFLSLSNMTALEYVDDGSKDFSSSLAFASTVFFPSLTVLNLEHLPNLKGWMPPCTSSGKELVNEVETTLRTISMADHDLHRCERCLFPCLSKLTIEYCLKLTSMPLAPNLKNLVLINTNMEIMVASKFPKITSATTASSSLALPLSSPFPKLESLHMVGIEDCVSLPEEGLRNLTSLKILQIWKCPRLTSLSQGIGHLTALQKLDIWDCKELVVSDEDGMQWLGLGSLRSLEIGKVPKLVSLPEWLQRVTTLQHLEIHSCSKLMTLPEWIGNFTSLHELRIRFCRNLASLPESIHRLTSIQRLSISKCPRLTRRCHVRFGEDWPKIAHVPNIEIDGLRILYRD